MKFVKLDTGENFDIPARYGIRGLPILLVFKDVYDLKGNHHVTTQTTQPVWGMTCAGCENSIRFAPTSLEGVRRVNPGRRAKTVEVDYAPGFIRLEGTPRAVEDIEYRAVAS